MRITALDGFFALISTAILVLCYGCGADDPPARGGLGVGPAPSDPVVSVHPAPLVTVVGETPEEHAIRVQNARIDADEAQLAADEKEKGNLIEDGKRKAHEAVIAVMRKVLIGLGSLCMLISVAGAVAGIAAMVTSVPFGKTLAFGIAAAGAGGAVLCLAFDQMLDHVAALAIGVGALLAVFVAWMVVHQWRLAHAKNASDQRASLLDQVAAEGVTAAQDGLAQLVDIGHAARAEVVRAAAVARQSAVPGLREGVRAVRARLGMRAPDATRIVTAPLVPLDPAPPAAG